MVRAGAAGPVDGAAGHHLQFNAGASAATVRSQVEAQWGAMAPRVMAGGLPGTPDEAVDRIAEYVDAGAGAVNVASRAPWLPEALDAWLGDVAPRAKAAAG